jgi:serine beta-lactamase-like protein LACTB, mitochondrial
VSPKRRHVEFALAGLLAVGLVAVGAVFIYSYLISAADPLYTDAAAIPSNAAELDAGPYWGAIEKVRSAARELLVAENLPSLSIAVASDGKIVWAEGVGFASVEKRVPVTPRTRFRTGSVSKTMTAMALGLLHDRGRLDLDAPVQTYVPAYPQKQWTITSRQLMGDIAGVHRAIDGNDTSPRGQCERVDQALKIFYTEPLLFEPGTQYKFSNLGWILLSAVVEGATGEAFPTFMSREVFKPLGMDRTVLEGTDKDSDDVTFYFPREASDGGEPEEAPEAEYGCFFGAGGYVSTPSDLVRLGSAIVTTSAKASAFVEAPDKSAVKKPGLLKTETAALLQTPLQLKSGASTGFALGWKVDTIPLAGKQTRLVRHRASLIRGRVSLSVFPELGLVIAVMSNHQHYLVDQFAEQVAAAFVSAH